MSWFRKRPPNEFRWRRGAWRNDHGDTIANGVFIVADRELADPNPPSASLDPKAHRHGTDACPECVAP